MDGNEVNLVNLHVEQVRPPERTEVSLPQEQEDQGMLRPDVTTVVEGPLAAPEISFIQPDFRGGVLISTS